MNTRMSRCATVIVGTATYLFLGFATGAADISGDANGISISSAKSANSPTISVVGPNGYKAVTTGLISGSGDKSQLADGVYKYEVTDTQCGSLSESALRAAIQDNTSNGRAEDARPANCRHVVIDSGAFRIVNGVVPSSTLVEE